MQRYLTLAILISTHVLLSTSCEREPADAAQWTLSECQGCTTAQEAALCNDGLDNDGDQLVDCDDPNCKDVGCCAFARPENDDESCSDGCDNDGDNFVDCLDRSCCSKDSCVPICKSPEKSDETTIVACSDGIDNDWNGFIDCADYSCSQSPEVYFCEGNDQTCSDDIDNDGNGFVDCGDYSCSRNSKVTVCKQQ